MKRFWFTSITLSSLTLSTLLLLGATAPASPTEQRIMDFIDAHSFDLRSIKKTCVHIVSPDLRIIPFDTYNMFYRGELEQTVLEPIRQELALAGMALLTEDERRVVSRSLPMAHIEEVAE